MGKIKEKRHTFHLSAPKANSVQQQSYVENNRTPENINFKVQNSIQSSIFKNVTIPSHALKQKLPVYSEKDACNFRVKELLGSKLYQDKSLGKDDLKRHNKGFCRRKIPFSEVVSSLIDYQKKKEKEEKKKKKAILGNYGALKEALPTLDQLVKESNINQEAKPRVAKRFSKQEAEMMEDIQTYQQVLNNSQYALDPFGTITAQLQQKLQSGSL